MMIQKGFIANKSKRASKETRYGSMVSKSLLCLGLVILISVMIYMIAHFHKADEIMVIVFPFMIAGSFLIWLSQVIRWKYVKFRS